MSDSACSLTDPVQAVELLNMLVGQLLEDVRAELILCLSSGLLREAGRVVLRDALAGM